MTRHIPLADLEGEIVNRKWPDGFSSPAVLFLCPVCLERNNGDPVGVHSHLVPYIPGQASSGRHGNHTHIWGHVSGSVVDDITLQPSYLARCSGSCRVHCFIRGGVVQLLGDSGPLGAP